jgi:hypothetical protein
LLRAAQVASDAAVEEAITARRDVMVETVLSSRKFEPTVTAALQAGYKFGFVYVTVRSVELNIQRVALRVEEGGHDVPEDRVRSRRERSRGRSGGLPAAHRSVSTSTTAARPRSCLRKSGAARLRGTCMTRGRCRRSGSSFLPEAAEHLDPPRCTSA